MQQHPPGPWPPVPGLHPSRRGAFVIDPGRLNRHQNVSRKTERAGLRNLRARYVLAAFPPAWNGVWGLAYGGIPCPGGGASRRHNQHQYTSMPQVCGSRTSRVACGPEGRGRVARPFGFALTDPGVRLSRTRLLPRVLDGKALAWPRVEDARAREPGVSELR
jgi:hypothetical protein